jgi:hypothetical protein
MYTNMIILEPHGRCRCRQEDNMKMDLQGKGGGGMQWIDLTTGAGHGLL